MNSIDDPVANGRVEAVKGKFEDRTDAAAISAAFLKAEASLDDIPIGIQKEKNQRYA